MTMVNTVRPQASTVRRPNPTYVPPVPAEDDPLNPELGSDRPLYSTDPARDKTLLAERQFEPQTGSFAPLAWIIALVIVGAIAYYFYASSGTNQTTTVTPPAAQSTTATPPAAQTPTPPASSTTATPPAAPKASDGTATPPAATPPAAATPANPPADNVPKSN
jgi:cytoskeletal protein RodZ